jgi:predicted RNA-binding Zn-ribbon protein involved in translation (DUF1610 family)
MNNVEITSEKSSVLRCACCGGEMGLKSESKVALVYECKECGLSDTRMKSEEQTGTRS